MVTGAGSGIGRAVAHALSAEGSRTVLVDIDGAKAEAAAAAIRSQGCDARAFKADVADPESVAALHAFVREELGPLDILVNNAAIQVNKKVEDTSPEEWNRQMAVNVGGVFLCSREFLPDLRQTRGVIINMSSVNGFFVEPSCAGYCATKGAILAFTKAIAIDHGREGIRIHAICPGYINRRVGGRLLRIAARSSTGSRGSRFAACTGKDRTAGRSGTGCCVPRQQ